MKTEEEIIINDVNITECQYAILPKNQCPNKPMPYAKETSCIACKEHNTKLNFCKNNPECYFKQLQRLKEENVKLLFDKGTLIEFCNKLTKIIDEKKENENKIFQTLNEIKQLVSAEYIKTKKQLVQNYDCLDIFMQKIEDKCNEVLK